jgi:stearoyl-CoA desaturase (delta-9 desaturase)
MFGWMFHMEEVQSSESLRRQVPDLMSDKLYRALGDSHSGSQAMLCLGINVAFRLAIFAMFGWVACLANTLAMLIVFVSTQFVNAICHMPGWGYRSFDSKDDSLNVWWVAILTLGEGWHNNHHGIPTSARHGLSWWEVDVTWITTDILQKVGLATNIVLPPKDKKPRPTFKRDTHRKTAKQLSR